MRINQLVRLGRKKRKRSVKNTVMSGYPQRAGICLQVLIFKPKKPNSANRPIARIKLSDGTIVLASIRGEKQNLQEHSKVAIIGGRVKDLPGIKNKVLRGRYDVSAVEGRRTSRSKYGTKKNVVLKTKNSSSLVKKEKKSLKTEEKKKNFSS